MQLNASTSPFPLFRLVSLASAQLKALQSNVSTFNTSGCGTVARPSRMGAPKSANAGLGGKLDCKQPKTSLGCTGGGDEEIARPDYPHVLVEGKCC